MFYFIPTIGQPNSAAASNRCASFIKGFSELGVKTMVVHFETDDIRFGFKQNLPNIKYKNLYIDNEWANSYLKYLFKFLFIFRFIIGLNKNDTIFLYGNAYIWYWVKKLKPNIKVYVEETELPEVVGLGGKFLTPSWKNYYKLLPKLDGLFVISTALKDYFKSKGVTEDKIHISNITVDPMRFAGLTRKTTEKYIAYCGTASNNKDGVDQLIKAFALVAKDVADVKLYIIGSIPKNDKAGNLRLIQESGCSDRIVLTGVVPASDMPRYLKNAQVLALARPNNIQARYGFATKMGEYLMTKNPVVVTNVGDFHLFLKDKESVLFAEPDNVVDFADKLKWALQHPEESEKIGNNGYEIAMDKFTYISVSKHLVECMNVL